MRRAVTISAALLILAFPLPSTTPSTAQSPPYPWGTWCGLEVAGYNADRHVYGPVNFECSHECFHWYNWVHSYPFGNWGVVSNLSGMYDGRQYMGWAYQNAFCPSENIDNPEWNSCTSETPLSPSYFNHQNNTQQISHDASPYGWYVVWENTDEDQGCARANGMVVATLGNFMELYELDPIGDDRRITTLQFPDTYLTASCSGPDTCEPVFSDWVPNWDTNPVSSAWMRMRLAFYQLWREGKDG